MKYRTLLVPLLALTLTGCGGLGNTSSGSILNQQEEIAPVGEEATKPTVPEGALVDESGDFVFDGKLQQIGDDENGYIQVPLGYVRFQDEDVDGLTQYSDISGTNIFTLERYEGISYQSAAENMLAFIQQQEDITDVQGATVQVAGYNALQLYGRYTDGIVIVIWFIEDPANTSDSYYLAIEFDTDHPNLVACSASFQTVEDYHAAEENTE